MYGTLSAMFELNPGDIKGEQFVLTQATNANARK